MDVTDARLLLQAAVEEAQAGAAEGGLPIGSVIQQNTTEYNIYNTIQYNTIQFTLYLGPCWWTRQATSWPGVTTCGCRPGTPPPTPRWLLSSG